MEISVVKFQRIYHGIQNISSENISTRMGIILIMSTHFLSFDELEFGLVNELDSIFI